MIHGEGIDAVLYAELESGLIGLSLLTTRVGVLGQLLSEVAKESRGDGSGGGVHGGDAVPGGHHQIGSAIGVADVLVNQVSQLVADDGEQLVVVHHIHQTRVNTNAAIAAGESVHGARLIDLIIQVQVVNVVELGHHAVQTLRVVAVGRGDGVLLVHLGHVFSA